MKRLHLGLPALALAMVSLAGVTITGALAQQQPPASGQKPAQKAARPATPPTAPAAAATDQAAPSRGDSQLRQRVEQLEEQLVDLQVTIGTLESLARTSGGASIATGPVRPSYGGSPGAADQSGTAARVDGLEIQLRALLAQVEQLNDQVRALSGRRGGLDTASDQRIAAAPPPRVTPAQPAAVTGFGSVTVSPGSGDQIGRILTDDAARPPAAAPGAEGSNPKQSYETAYGYLLQQNYGAAEAAFDEFLTRHPNDALAGNAQYWLGESFFVRGQFKQAAGAFLKGYQTYGRSIKAPDSLLKLAMSLDRLGQKDAACSSYAELNTRFPAAAQTVKARADSERRRIGC